VALLLKKLRIAQAITGRLKQTSGEVRCPVTSQHQHPASGVWIRVKPKKLEDRTLGVRVIAGNQSDGQRGKTCCCQARVQFTAQSLTTSNQDLK
jgi:hypothetical protein